MTEAVIPDNEQQRISSLRRLKILDTPPEERFDRITRIGQKLLNVPTVLVSLVDTDRQWFKSVVGLDAKETSRGTSFCAHAIHQNDIFVIPDALKDERFKDNPLVVHRPKIRFYAGQPLKSLEGYNLGTLCFISPHPKELTADEKRMIKDLALWVELEINSKELSSALAELKEKNEELERINKVMIKRELRIIELKNEINALKEKS